MDASERRTRAIQEATQWWNRLCIGRPTEISRVDRELFTQWLRESPLHVAELLRIAHMHGALERFKRWGEIEAGNPGETSNVIPLREDPVEASGASSRSTEADARPRSRAGFWALAASACLVAIFGGWLALGERGQRIETELAERRQVMLDDGSVVQLEPETKIRVRFEDSNRLVALERGRALFRVAKDPRRPFVVSTDHASVRAVGTAFGVESMQQGVVITVAEGTVAVGRASGKRQAHTPLPESPDEGRAEPGAAPDTAASEILVSAGQQVVVQSSGAMDSVRSVDAARALAWSQGQLIFDNAALADVVVEFNRYNRTQLRIDDLRLATRPVSGVFAATDIETLLAFIGQGSSDIRVTHTDRAVVIGSSGRSLAPDDSPVQ
jgi:transmembrane sensor